MKITGQNPSIAKELATGQAKSKEVSRDKESGEASRLQNGGSVKTSSFTLDKIQDRIDAEPDIRLDKVEELKAQIKNGQYKVDFEGLAEKLINDSLKEDV